MGYTCADEMRIETKKLQQGMTATRERGLCITTAKNEPCTMIAEEKHAQHCSEEKHGGDARHDGDECYSLWLHGEILKIHSYHDIITIYYFTLQSLSLLLMSLSSILIHTPLNRYHPYDCQATSISTISSSMSLLLSLFYSETK